MTGSGNASANGGPSERVSASGGRGTVGGFGKADFRSSEQTRWCPGCGDYAVLAAVQEVMARVGLPPERIVFISGIGCAGRFVYYMNTYGMHGVHGRAPALATGLATARPDLSVWVVTGDGDALSIGGNHLIHALRRNVPVKILLLNNEVYGLTKGQPSPTTRASPTKRSPSAPTLEAPFDPVALALGAGATFVARSIDIDKQHLGDVLMSAARHSGSALVEIYQNCPVFNDGAFGELRTTTVNENEIRLENGRPIRLGSSGERGVVRRPDGTLDIVRVADVGEENLVVHDAQHADSTAAFALAQLGRGPGAPTPVGIFRAVDRPVFGAPARGEEHGADVALDDAQLRDVLHDADTWRVSDRG